MELATEIWDEHIEVFTHFDLVCHNGHSLEDETRSNALFNSLITLDILQTYGNLNSEAVQEAIDYLKGSKYYSEKNKNSSY